MDEAVWEMPETLWGDFVGRGGTKVQFGPKSCSWETYRESLRSRGFLRALGLVSAAGSSDCFRASGGGGL